MLPSGSSSPVSEAFATKIIVNLPVPRSPFSVPQRVPRLPHFFQVRRTKAPVARAGTSALDLFGEVSRGAASQLPSSPGGADSARLRPAGCLLAPDGMALQRQASGTLHVGIPSSSSADHEGLGSQRPFLIGHSRMYDEVRNDRSGLRTSILNKPARLSKGKRTPHSWRGLSCSMPCVLAVCFFGLVATIFSSQFFMGGRRSAQTDDVFGQSDRQQWTRGRAQEYVRNLGVDVDDEQQSGSDKSGTDGSVWFGNGGIDTGVDGDQRSSSQDVPKKLPSGSLYNERGRDELVEIGARYEDRHVSTGEKEDTVVENRQNEGSHSGKSDFDEYDDDGGDVEVEKKPDSVDNNQDDRWVHRLRGASDGVQTDAGGVDEVAVLDKPAEQNSRITTDVHSNQDTVPGDTKVQKPSRPRKRRHSATPPCEIDFLSSAEGLEEPVNDGVFVNISLSYVESEARPFGNPDWMPKFGGHQSLTEREASFHADDQTLQCGFVKAPSGEPWTGFELSESDKEYLSTCHIAVSSCIFGAWDYLRTPTNKKMSNSSKAKVCFVMFVDQKSLDVILEEGQKPNDKGILGLWKIVLIKNLPYLDGRRNGKVPKLLTHRLFPNARYSIWLDSKLRLHADPLLILERFLWRGNHEYAISNHYDRHCVWEEVAQNKRLNKFNHSVIDDQFQFYKREGLPRFNKSDPNRYLPSHVPEGSFIVRAHTPMSNLFSCLWFNEVERFTPRDQLSFAATYIKLARMNPTKRFRFNMFKDCERKAMAKLYHHRTDAGSAVPHI